MCRTLSQTGPAKQILCASKDLANPFDNNDDAPHETGAMCGPMPSSLLPVPHEPMYEATYTHSVTARSCTEPWFMCYAQKPTGYGLTAAVTTGAGAANGSASSAAAQPQMCSFTIQTHCRPTKSWIPAGIQVGCCKLPAGRIGKPGAARRVTCSQEIHVCASTNWTVLQFPHHQTVPVQHIQTVAWKNGSEW